MKAQLFDFGLIVASYNQPKNIEPLLEAIHSNAVSSGATFKLIVVDDASTGDTQVKLQDLKRRGLITELALLSKNRGVSYARNHGMSLAAGCRWITFFDDDDCVDESLVNILKKVSVADEHDCWVTGYFKFEANKRHICFWEGEGTLCKNSLFKYVQDYCVQPNRNYAFVHVWSKFYLEKTISKHHIQFNERMKLHEDIEFNLRFLSVARRIGYMPDAFYNHVISKRSASFVESWDLDGVLSIIYVARKLKKYLIGNGMSQKLARIITGHMIWNYLIVNMIRMGSRVGSVKDFKNFLDVWRTKLNAPFYLSTLKNYNSGIVGGSYLIPHLIAKKSYSLALFVAFIKGKKRYGK